MPSAVPARMYLRSFYFDTQAQRRRRVVALLLLALVEPGSRYSLNDPRIEPSPPPPSRRSRPKPPASSTPSRRTSAQVSRATTEHDPFVERHLPTVSTRRSSDARGHMDDTRHIVQ